MHRIDTTTAVPVMPAPNPVGNPGFFAHGSPTVPYTVVSADFLNTLQEEIGNVVRDASITLDKSQNNQLLSAINAKIGGTALGFVPVQQGGGASQLGNKVRIGWDGSFLRGQVDATDMGRFAMQNGANVFSQSQTMSASLAVGATVSANQVIGNALISNGNASVAGTLTGGALVSNGVINGAGNITSTGGRLRAAYGARGSGDGAAACILSDFDLEGYGASGGSTTSFSQIFPNGFIIKAGQWNSDGRQAVTITYTPAFPNNIMGIWVTAITSAYNNVPILCAWSNPSAPLAQFFVGETYAVPGSGSTTFCWLAMGY